MRLIDADALDYLTHRECMGHGDYYDMEIVTKVRIDNAPTIDAVEVVRCKDCRHANECRKIVQYSRNEQNTVSMGYLPIEWCSRGERREP